MPDLNTLRTRLKSGEHAFADTLAFIAAGYDYQPQALSLIHISEPTRPY